jgi:predicted nucleic acid-binding protein
LRRFVVDASVAIKWYVPEPESEAAIQLLAEDCSLFSPDLLFPEVGNIVWKKIQRREISRDDGHGILLALSRTRIAVHASSKFRLADHALEVATATMSSFYDSLYVSLAALTGFPLVTADRRLLKRLDHGPFARHLVWVEDAV